MRIGPLVVGMEAAAVKSALGPYSRRIDGPKSTAVWFYFLGNPNEEPYLLASIWQQRLVAIQVTGHKPADKFGFNDLTLGATTETVTKVFGAPKRSIPSSQPNTDVWLYHPWTFSFELSGGRLTSIRVADPQFD